MKREIIIDIRVILSLLTVLIFIDCPLAAVIGLITFWSCSLIFDLIAERS